MYTPSRYIHTYIHTYMTYMCVSILNLKISWFFYRMYAFKNTPWGNWWWTLWTQGSGYAYICKNEYLYSYCSYRYVQYSNMQYSYYSTLGNGTQAEPLYMVWNEGANEWIITVLCIILFEYYCIHTIVFDKSQQLSCCCVKCHALKVTTTASRWLIIHKNFIPDATEKIFHQGNYCNSVIVIDVIKETTAHARAGYRGWVG